MLLLSTTDIKYNLSNVIIFIIIIIAANRPIYIFEFAMDAKTETGFGITKSIS